MTRRILVSGGPVHAYLDAVKLLTNKFKGGRMFALAQQLACEGADVTYLTTKLNKLDDPHGVNVVYHDGYHDYRRLVRELAPQHDAVILGAAVANLVPVSPWKGKFPSHQYKIGEVFNIPMTVAPRVIDEVKREQQVDSFPYANPDDLRKWHYRNAEGEIVEPIPASNPNCHLFGYKLLANVPHEELIEAAYDIVLASGATAVFANDASNLDQKYAVTKERAVIPLKESELPEFILQCLDDVYYKTVRVEAGSLNIREQSFEIVKALASVNADKFPVVQGGYVFGTVATRISWPGQPPAFVTTARGKRELQDWAVVAGVDHVEREVRVVGKNKATLNAPLLAHIFSEFPQANRIVHYHQQEEGVRTMPWAPPGTGRDSLRDFREMRAEGEQEFQIEHHGMYCFW